MVVGNGLIAKRFIDYSDNNKFLIFASGVSNSKSTIQADYDREFVLLKQIIVDNTHKAFVYFSTCSIDDPSESSSNYISHKKNIEKFIQSNVDNYLIFRVSNLVGNSSNSNTILNYITNNVSQQIHFDLWSDATRNLIDVDDFYKIVNYTLQNNLFQNRIINIANPRNYSVQEIVTTAENYFNRKANYTLVIKGCTFNINIADITPFFEPLHLQFGDDYLEKLLKKYY